MKLWEDWEKLHTKATLRLSSGKRKFFLKTIYNNHHSFPEGWACLSLCHYRKYKAPMMMRQNRMILCIQGDSGPAGCTLLFHSSAFHITALPICNPSPGWDGPRVKGSRWGCSLIAVQCFAFLPDLHQLYSSLPPNFPSAPLFSIFEDVTKFSHQHEMFTVKSQVYFVQCAFAR